MPVGVTSDRLFSFKKIIYSTSVLLIESQVEI